MVKPSIYDLSNGALEVEGGDHIMAPALSRTA